MERVAAIAVVHDGAGALDSCRAAPRRVGDQLLEAHHALATDAVLARQRLELLAMIESQRADLAPFSAPGRDAVEIGDASVLVRLGDRRGARKEILQFDPGG